MKYKYTRLLIVEIVICINMHIKCLKKGINRSHIKKFDNNLGNK